jgi:energy-coupling factor transporter ATP-binding protein EcfA2
MIRVEAVNFCYEDATAPAIEGLSLRVGPGQIVGVAGAEGSGRSTLFRLLNGSAPCFFRGKVWGEALEVNGLEPARLGHAAMGAFVASIFDDPDAQIASLTVEEEVSFALVQRGMPIEDTKARVAEALERVGLSGFSHRSTASLSGGQKQRLVAASAIALKPRVLLADEGTSALDPEGAREFFDLVNDMRTRDGTTAVLFERDLSLLFEYCDVILFMEGGRAVFQGHPRECAQRPDLMRALGLRLPAWLELCAELKERGALEGELPCREEEAIDLLRSITRVRESA